MPTDKLFWMDAPSGEHPESEYLTLRGYRHGHRAIVTWPGEEKPASRIEVALLDALEREEKAPQYPIVALREEMARLVQAFAASSYGHELSALQREVRQVRRDLDEFRRLIVPMKELDERFEKELTALEGGLPPTPEGEEEAGYNFEALMDDLE